MMIAIELAAHQAETAFDLLTRTAQTLAATNLVDAHALLDLAQAIDEAMIAHALPRLQRLQADIAQPQLPF